MKKAMTLGEFVARIRERINRDKEYVCCKQVDLNIGRNGETVTGKQKS